MTVYVEDQSVPSLDSFSSLFMELESFFDNEVQRDPKTDTTKIEEKPTFGVHKEEQVQVSNGLHCPTISPCILDATNAFDRDNPYLCESKPELQSLDEGKASLKEEEENGIIALKEALIIYAEEFQDSYQENTTRTNNTSACGQSYIESTLNEQCVVTKESQKSFTHLELTNYPSTTPSIEPEIQNTRGKNVDAIHADYDAFTGETTVTIGGHRYAIDTSIAMETTAKHPQLSDVSANNKTNIDIECGSNDINDPATERKTTTQSRPLENRIEQINSNNICDPYQKNSDSILDVMGRGFCTEERSRSLSESFLEQFATQTATDERVQLQTDVHHMHNDCIDLLDISYSNIQNQLLPGVHEEHNDSSLIQGTSIIGEQSASSNVQPNLHIPQQMLPSNLSDPFSQWTKQSVSYTDTVNQLTCALPSVSDRAGLTPALSWTTTPSSAIPENASQPHFNIDSQSCVSSSIGLAHTTKGDQRHGQSSPAEDRDSLSPKQNSSRFLKPGCRLWEFIRNLLLDPVTNPSVICWQDRSQGVFRLVKSKEIAKIWGQKKGNEGMSYEKLSRAMRYYYKRKIFEPVIGKRLLYKFGPLATGWREDEVSVKK